MQKTPLGGATVGVDWMAGPPNCCTLDDVASCATAGDAAKSSAEINASFFICQEKRNRARLCSGAALSDGGEGGLGGLGLRMKWGVGALLMVPTVGSSPAATS